MNLKNFISGWLTAFVVCFLLGFIWHKQLMEQFYAENNPAVSNEINIAMIVVGYLVMTSLMTYLFAIGNKGASAIRGGFRYGSTVGLLWIVPLQIVYMGAGAAFTFNGIFVDGLWHIVEEGIGGICMAMVYLKMSSPPAA